MSREWLFDLDGTLVDSGPVHEAAFRAAIAELAPGFLDGFRYSAYAGATTREVVARLGARGHVAEQLIARKQQLYRGYVDAGRIAAFPGADRLLANLTRLGEPVYLVTSGSRRSVERVLAGSSLASHLCGVLTGDDVPSSKPDPAIYREACRRWALDPATVLAVEDSNHGVRSAVGAGLRTLHVHTVEAAPGAIAMPDLDDVLAFLSLEGADSR